MLGLYQLDKLSHRTKLLLGLLLILLIGIFDTLTGKELDFSEVYILPISLMTWLLGKREGIIASFISTTIWLVVDFITDGLYGHNLVPVWNAVIRLAVFIIITVLLVKLKAAMEQERLQSRTDYLTGSVNSRSFIEFLQMEIDRVVRYEQPFTLVYIDLDNFKTVNDRFGHLTGDRILRSVVDFAKAHLRKTDIIARLGGDEFALLLPVTSEKSARTSLEKFRKSFVEEMRQHDWPVTFSAGAITCTNAPATADELIKMADELMYEVKHKRKKGIAYLTLIDQQPFQLHNVPGLRYLKLRNKPQQRAIG